MLEISVTFEKFQLVFNFMLFFTLTLFSLIHEECKVAKIWGAAAPPGSTLPAIHCNTIEKKLRQIGFFDVGFSTLLHFCIISC